MPAAKPAWTQQPFLSAIRVLLRSFYPRHTMAGTGNIDRNAAAVFVCNHLESYSPIVLALYFPNPYRPWVHSYLTIRERCVDYLEINFTRTSLKLHPPLSRWAAALLAPLCIRLMKAVGTIPVFKGEMRIRETFSESIASLKQGTSILLFPESPTKKFSQNINDFQNGFAHLFQPILQGDRISSAFLSGFYR